MFKILEKLTAKNKKQDDIRMPSHLSAAEQKQVQTVIDRARGDRTVPHSAQDSIPFQRMFPDGICRVTDNYYTKTIQFQDINYQLAQQEDQTAIFEEWCSFLNFFDSSIRFELSFMNMATDASNFEKMVRIPYQKDKTTDERFFILSLFAIAEEIEAQNAYTSGLMPIDLAIGLPPAHFGTQNKAFVRYFKRKEPIYFSYRDKLYSILIRDVQCYPQAFAAAAMMLGELATVPRALILDVGGFTADYLMLKNGHADLSTCDSLENGVILLYNRIRSKASSDLDVLLEETDVDAILLQGQGSSYGEEVAALVEYQAQEFVNDMLGALRERQLDLRTGRVIFVGGGACLLRRQIETSGKVAHPVFVEDVNANAKGFEYLYRCTVTGE